MMVYEKLNTLARKALGPIAAPLLGWYDRAARVLPWREEPTPYRVWVSEIMLQQTRVEAVKPYFERFVARLPNVAALAAVSEEELLKLWEGLGYYSRARNLQRAAKILVENYEGKLPSSYRELLLLPGIGPYSAGAVASIAFNRPKAAVDGNVLRVLARLAASEEDVGAPGFKKTAAEKIEEILPEGRCGDFNQALMELGAVVCLPGRPRCLGCPLAPLCDGYRTGVAQELPLRAPKPLRRVEEKTVLVLIRDNRCALRKRPAEGLLGGLWEFFWLPGILGAEEVKERLFEKGIECGEIAGLSPSKHLFTHIRWNMAGFFVQCGAGGEELTWCKREELEEKYAVASAFRAYLQAAASYLK